MDGMGMWGYKFHAVCGDVFVGCAECRVGGNVSWVASGLMERRDSTWIQLPSSFFGSLGFKAPYACLLVLRA